MVKRLKFRCSACGKTLTDPFATTIGIGPVCRMKRKEAEFNDLSIDLFHNASRSKYSYTIEDGIVCLIDEDSGRSVTNDARAVVEHIIRDLGDTFPGTIIYRDLYGIWDQIVVQAYRFAGFRELSTFDKDKAKDIVLRRNDPLGRAA